MKLFEGISGPKEWVPLRFEMDSRTNGFLGGLGGFETH